MIMRAPCRVGQSGPDLGKVIHELMPAHLTRVKFGQACVLQEDIGQLILNFWRKPCIQRQLKLANQTAQRRWNKLVPSNRMWLPWCSINPVVNLGNGHARRGAPWLDPRAILHRIIIQRSSFRVSNQAAQRDQLRRALTNRPPDGRRSLLHSRFAFGIGRKQACPRGSNKQTARPLARNDRNHIRSATHLDQRLPRTCGFKKRNLRDSGERPNQQKTKNEPPHSDPGASELGPVCIKRVEKWFGRDLAGSAIGVTAR